MQATATNESTRSSPERGNFYVTLNPTKAADNERPMMQGRISLPGSTEEKAVALWARESDSGLVLNGRTRDTLRAVVNERSGQAPEPVASASIKVAQMKDKDLVVDLDSLVLFTNKARAENPNRPHYFGYYNPGKGQPLMPISAWERSDARGPVLVGSVERDDPRRARDTQDPQPAATEPPARARSRAKAPEHDREM